MKCYVCKAINATDEFIRHRNEMAETTATLLMERVRKHRKAKRTDHLCERHLDPQHLHDDMVYCVYERRKDTQRRKVTYGAE